LFEAFGIFYRGLILGIMIAAPVGPIGLLCIRRSVQKGLLIGFATGLGAAFADTLFATVSALGIAAIMDFIRRYDMGLHIIGGMMLLYGAWHTWHDAPKPPSDPIDLLKKIVAAPVTDTSTWNAIKACISGFAITLTNPITIFAVLAVVATFSHVDNRLDAATLVGGIFCGSVLWWLTLSGGVTLLRGYFTESRIIVVNKVTATILAALALWAVVQGINALVARLQTIPT
jgi:hypothetical protein